MLATKIDAATRTMTAPAGMRGAIELINVPRPPLTPPITAERIIIVVRFCVQKRAAVGGVISKAMMRISPTA